MAGDAPDEVDEEGAGEIAPEPDSVWIIGQLRDIANRKTKLASKEDLQITLRALELLARERGLFARPTLRPRRLSDLPVEELRAALARLEPR